MMLTARLKQTRQAVLDGWFSQVIDTYPADSANFLTEQSNQFANPVGSTLRKELEVIFNEFLGDMNTKRISNALDRINRVRAVQDFSASQAVAFIFFLKSNIRRELAQEMKGEVEEMLALEARIDTLALLAFDSYMHCRERLFEVRCNDIKRQVSLATARTVKSLPKRSEGDQ